MLELVSYRSRKRIYKILILILIIVGMFNTFKALPHNVSYEGDGFMVPEQSVHFLADETFLDKDGNRQTEQRIFNKVFEMIKNAEEFILLDMFLYNNFQGVDIENTRALSEELTQLLINKKSQNSNIKITVITDPINIAYGGDFSEQFKELESAGIIVGITDLKPLKDSNPIYSSVWRTFFGWFGNSEYGGFVKHPFDSKGRFVTIRSYLALLNFKANHRKLIIADDNIDGVKKVVSLITSANPHDASSAHGNIALVVEDSIWQDLYITEKAVADFSNFEIHGKPKGIVDYAGEVCVKVITEKKIKEEIIEQLESTQKGEFVDIMMFYLSDRDIVKKIIKVANRGVVTRLILDPNKDAFGHSKNGIPNRQVAYELLKQTKGNNLKIRWCDTHGEQCHSKMVLIRGEDKNILILGSANLTKRNIGNYNLETNVSVKSKKEIRATQEGLDYFNRLWHNEQNRQYTVDYDIYGEKSLVKTILYRVMESTGLSTF